MNLPMPLTLVSEISLTYKTKIPTAERPVISSSKDAHMIFMDYWNIDTIELYEEVKMLMLNQANHVLGIITLSHGGMNGAICDPKVIFSAALLSKCNGIILAHNHPSGNRKPSQLDITLTKKLKKAGELLEIRVLDHLIITSDNGYYSLADEGVL